MRWFWRAAIGAAVGMGASILFRMLIAYIIPPPGPMFFVLFVSATLFAYFLSALVAIHLPKRAHDDAETRCRKCGYILRGISEPRCPECGERI